MRRSGFTLMELSIVLIIVALLTGGVLMGTDMIQAAQVRAAIKQIESFNVAMATFKAKYKCLPGDCLEANRWDFQSSPLVMNHNDPWRWLAFDMTTPAHAGSAFTGGSSSMGDVDANGDGNSRIDSTNEHYNAIAILNQAGLLSGVDVANSQVNIAMKASSSAGVQGFWYVQYLTAYNSTVSSISVPGHYLWALSTVAVTAAGTPVILPKDAYAIDAKIDDGLPRTGKVLATGHNTNPVSMTAGPVYTTAGDAGAVGATSNYCVTTQSPIQYNVQNISRATGSLCSMTVEMEF